MKSLNKLNLSPLKKTPLNKTISRRMKLLNNLNKQLKYSIINDLCVNLFISLRSQLVNMGIN